MYLVSAPRALKPAMPDQNLLLVLISWLFKTQSSPLTLICSSSSCRHASPPRPLVTGAGRSTANLILPRTISHWFFWAGSLKFLKVKVNSRQAALRVWSLTIIRRFTGSRVPIRICRQPPGSLAFVRNETGDWLCHTAHVYEVTRSCLPHSIIIVMNHHASLNHISDYIFY